MSVLSTRWRASVEAGKLLTDQEVREVNEAIAEAAKTTSARILPVVATSSVRLGRAEELLGLWAAALGLALILLFLSLAPVGREWAHDAKVSKLAIVPVGLVIVLGFVAGILLGGRIGWLRRLFLARKRVVETVRRRARQIHDNVLLHEKDEPDAAKLAVLYVSLAERTVALIANEDLEARLTQEQLDAVSQRVADGVAKRQTCQALCDGIARAAEVLAADCPPAQDAVPGQQTHLQIID